MTEDRTLINSLREALKGAQHKIDANKNGKIDSHDFEVLRGMEDDEGWYAHREMHGNKGVSKEDWKKGVRLNSKGERVQIRKEDVDLFENSDEPDYEGQMAKTELKAICDKSGKLDTMLSDNDQLEAWVQSKISIAKMHIDAVHDYMMYRNKPSMEAKVPNMGAKVPNMSAYESVDFFAEAKRGRPRKDGSKPSEEDDTQEADKNIMNQLRKRPEGEHHTLTFNNGEKKKVHVVHATRALTMLQNSKPTDRLDLQNSLSHSHSRFMDTVRTGKAIKDEPRARVSLAKRVSEEVELDEAGGVVPSYKSIPSGPINAGVRGAWDSATIGGGKYLRAGVDYAAKKIMGQDTSYSKELDQEIEKDTKAQKDYPTAWKVGDYAADAATIATGVGGLARLGAKGLVKAGVKGAGAYTTPTKIGSAVDRATWTGFKAGALGHAAGAGHAYGKGNLQGYAQREFGEDVENNLEEGINNMSDAKLKFHALKNVPHGSYTKKEISAEHERRKKTMGPKYNEVTPTLNEVKAADSRGRTAVTFRDPHSGRMKVKWVPGPKKDIRIESVQEDKDIVAKPKIKTGKIGFMKGGGAEQHVGIAEAFLIELTNDQIEIVNTVYDKLNEKNKEAFFNSAASSAEGSQAMLDFAINIE